MPLKRTIEARHPSDTRQLGALLDVPDRDVVRNWRKYIHRTQGIPMFLKTLKVSNFLSFGPEGIDLPMKPLTVLIGANGSGKSNLLEAIALLCSEKHTSGGDAGDTQEYGRRTRFSRDVRNVEDDVIKVQGVLNTPSGVFHHSRVLTHIERSTYFVEDHIDKEDPNKDSGYETITEYGTAISWLKHIQRSYARIRMYRSHDFSKVLVPASVPDENDPERYWLREDYRNLIYVIDHIRKEKPRTFQYDIENLGVDVLSMPYARMSPGMLRYLTLVAILSQPEPPPLVCIEEPTYGIHPDLIPTIVSMMEDVSSHMQIIVTTHSDMLIDALETPESVVVCEKDDHTTVRRLDPDILDRESEEGKWSGLSDMWLSGAIGGNRW